MTALLYPRGEEEQGDGGAASAKESERSTAMVALLRPERRGGARRWRRCFARGPRTSTAMALLRPEGREGARRWRHCFCQRRVEEHGDGDAASPEGRGGARAAEAAVLASGRTSSGSSAAAPRVCDRTEAAALASGRTSSGKRSSAAAPLVCVIAPSPRRCVGAHEQRKQRRRPSCVCDRTEAAALASGRT
jgi:hypothetical protein